MEIIKVKNLVKTYKTIQKENGLFGYFKNLVKPKYKEFDAVNEPMFIDNFEDIKEYCNDIICYYSDNDPYVKFETEKAFADAISNNQYVIKNGGHINTESGYTKFEEILRVL